MRTGYFGYVNDYFENIWMEYAYLCIGISVVDSHCSNTNFLSHKSSKVLFQDLNTTLDFDLRPLDFGPKTLGQVKDGAYCRYPTI